MGDRGQVLVKDNDKDTGVYLYTHWGASKLVHDVKDAIAKRWRWYDTSYLTRIIFDIMSEGEQGEETGYGIGTISAGDAWRTIVVNVDKQTVEIQDLGLKMSFEDFSNSSF